MLRLCMLYYQIQQWPEIKLKPEQWEWILQVGDLHSESTTLHSVSDEIMKLIYFSCKDGYSAQCNCKKSEITCSALICGGQFITTTNLLQRHEFSNNLSEKEQVEVSAEANSQNFDNHKEDADDLHFIDCYFKDI